MILTRVFLISLICSIIGLFHFGCTGLAAPEKKENDAQEVPPPPPAKIKFGFFTKAKAIDALCFSP